MLQLIFAAFFAARLRADAVQSQSFSLVSGIFLVSEQRRRARCGATERANSDSTVQTLAHDVLALTKVNWNTTQFDQKLPAPIKTAREAGRILKHVEFGTKVSADFRRYI